MSQPNLVGTTLGNYRIEARLGTGGMGQVYRARHLHLDWTAAVKVLHAHHAADDGFRARFLQEARAVAMLEHPNIVRLIDFGQQDDQLYLVMELLTDGSLRTLLRDRSEPDSGWSLSAGIGLVRQAADGLAYAHARNMIHRDIKPDNLLLQVVPGGDRRYTAKLADFGLARLGDGGGMTASGVTLGTPAYMSPEQCQGIEVDGRCDIYSLGIVLYEVVTGRLPFRTRSVSDAIYNHVYVAPPPPRLLQPGLSGELEAVVLRCLAKHPDERYQSMAELAERLDAAVSNLAPDRPATNLRPRDGGARNPIDAPVPIAIEVESANQTPPGPALPDAVPAGAPSAFDTVGVQVPRVYVLNRAGEVIEMADLTGDGLSVGRLEDNRLVIDVDGVSRHHLLIDWDGNRAHVTDIGSSHGTSLAGTLIPAHVARDWDPDDTVQIGGLRLRLVVPAAPVAGQPRHDPASATDPAWPVPLAKPLVRRRWPILGAVGAVIAVLAVVAALVFAAGDGEDPGQADAGDLPPTPATGFEWIAETVADPAVGPLLGQPLADPVAVRTPFQVFERGVIVSLSDVLDDGGILVAVANPDNGDAGNYTYFDPVAFDGVFLETPEPGPPADYYVPSEPFAAIWQAVPGLRDAIGWASSDTPGDGVIYQTFERGVVVFLADTSRTWVYYGDLTLDSSNAWRAFWNEIVADDGKAAEVGLQAIARVSALDEVSARLGASVTDATPVEIPYQLFEHGLMFTSDFLALVDPAAAGYVITLVAEGGEETGSWRSDHLVTVMLESNTTLPGTPPAGLHPPGYPFDLIFRHDPALVRALGWAVGSNLDSEAAWQRYENGYIIWFADTSRSWVILGNGVGAVSGDWRAYWEE